jgi:hypothetical protein
VYFKVNDLAEAPLPDVRVHKVLYERVSYPKYVGLTLTSFVDEPKVLKRIFDNKIPIESTKVRFRSSTVLKRLDTLEFLLQSSNNKIEPT